MGSKKFEKGSPEHRFFGDFWKFAQEFYLPDDSDEYWDRLIKSSNELLKKYPGEFFSRIVGAFTDYAEAVNRKNLRKE